MKKKVTLKRSHWDNLEAREKATLAFVQFLRDNPEEVPKCRKDGEYAKKKFAEGFFYLEGEKQSDPQHPLEPIPTETVFHVYEFAPPPPRDKLVALVLPPKDQAIDNLEPIDVWLCSWGPWRE